MLGARASRFFAAFLSCATAAAAADSGELLYSTEGNRLRRYDLDTIDQPPLVEDILVEQASASEEGGAAPAGKFRDINGMICPFPDGSGRFVAGEDTGQYLQPHEWRTYAGGKERQFFNPRESTITAANVAQLATKWTFPTGAIVTASPTVARVVVPGEGRIPVAWIQSWDGNVYAVRVRDGGELWRFAAEVRDGPSFSNAASVHYERIGGADRVFVGAGQTFYALDAATGTEVWRFDAGTGCVIPGACSFGAAGEHNEILSSAIVADGKVFFGMDVNDREGGKGGFYALDAADGRLAWFFDLESGMTCHPDPGDDVRRYDGYHSEADLGLPPGFFATRAGCNHPRSPNGCGNVWSSPAYDGKRGFLYFASSNCDTDANPATLRPLPPMPPYDEAIVALDLDGSPVWRWRPREVDNGDLAFGAAPNLFTAVIGGQEREVLGVGNKDGTYYVLDRDGVNEVSGLGWDDPSPQNLPYWRTNVVPGGPAGGIVATAAVDDSTDRIYFGTAPGSFSSVFSPQRPTMHALDAGTGAILWQNTAEPDADATFAPTSMIPGVVFTGSNIGGNLRAYDAATGDKLASIGVGFALAAAPVAADGVLLVGAGIGFRTGNPADPGETTSRAPQNLTALCVPATAACAVDTPIAGRRLRVTDRAGRPSARSLSVDASDLSIEDPTPGGSGDPTVLGARLDVLNPLTEESARLLLPAAGWKALGTATGTKGFTYRDGAGVLGPCTRALVKGGLLRARCKGAGLGFTLDEVQQAALVVALTVGNDRVYCLRFGGAVRADEGLATTGHGRFVAKDAPAPAACALP
jgi:polyvinyl alcohol dehydrogenase (cytochrome)